jgi:hypothetical protein
MTKIRPQTYFDMHANFSELFILERVKTVYLSEESQESMYKTREL